MNLAFVLVIAAVLALATILSVAVTRSLQVRGSAGLSGTIRPIDVEAFRNLINPDEDEYLRRRAAYIHVVASNAAVLVRVGQAALATGDTRVAKAAHELVEDALLLRRNATVALARIYLALAWPNSGFAAVRVFDRYERLSGAAMLLGRLQNPAVPVRLSTLP